MWVALVLLCTALVACAEVAAPRPEPPPRWRYVALGDSVAAGSGSETSYPEELAVLIERDRVARVDLDNRAVGGAESGELLRDLRRDGELRAAVRRADLVTITVGANDLVALHHRYRAGTCGGPDNLECYRRELVVVTDRWRSILEEVLGLQRRGRVRVTNYYDPYLGNDPLVREDLGTEYPAEARAIAALHNRAICDIAGDLRVPCADVHRAFNGADGSESAAAAGLLADDLFHPSEDGHRRIAGLVHALGYG